MDKRPIGIFDSGVGGLTVVKEITKALPNEDIIYLGDTARVPYGNRSNRTIINFALQDTRFLLEKEVKCIVIACNTASSVALSEIKAASPVTVFDVVSSGVKDAVYKSKLKKVAVIGTRATIGSHSYKDSIISLDKEFQVYEQACPLFVPFAEEGETKGELIEALTKKYLDKIDQEYDVLVMGCTHYPIIEDVLKKVADDTKTLINPGVMTAKTVKEHLTTNGLESGKKGKYEKYYFTDLNDNILKVAEIFLGRNINDLSVRIPSFS